jgi:hypothetical protein
MDSVPIWRHSRRRQPTKASQLSGHSTILPFERQAMIVPEMLLRIFRAGKIDKFSREPGPNEVKDQTLNALLSMTLAAEV